MNNQAQVKQEFLANLTNAKQVFLSFAAKISPVNFNLLLNNFANKPDDVIYISQPDKKFIFLSYDELTVQSFDQNEFHLIKKEIEVLRNKLITNHEEFPGVKFPVFITTAKFPKSKSSDEWNDFGKIDFIIPKIALFRNNEEYFILYNTLSESFSGHENLNVILENQIDKIYKLESRLASPNFNKSKIKFLQESDDELSWEKKVNSLLELIYKKEIEKIVLSKRIQFNCEQEVNWEFIFNDLNEKYSCCTNFLLKSNNAVFFGSSPELLARFEGNRFFTEALAGSIMRGKDSEEDLVREQQLLNSLKNKVEHDVVTNHITEALKDFVESIEIDNNTIVKKLSNIQHLQTRIRGRLKKGISLLDTISSFFPTPAVCGIPRDKTIDLISQAENFDRGLFAGLLGWLDCNGNGEFNVTIRSALLKGNVLNLYAGCGIVEGSDAKEEYEEINLKIKPILSLFENAN